MAAKPIRLFDTPIAVLIPVHKPFPFHVTTNGAEISMEIRNYDIHFPLRIDAVVLECVGNDLQNYA